MDSKLLLILTHLVPYIMIPLMMWGFYKRRDYYKKIIYSNLLIQLGFITIFISLVFEFSWHHFVQQWNYENTSHVLNLLFFTFMNLGFGLFSIGLYREKFTDALLVFAVLFTPIVYLLGYKSLGSVSQVIWLVILTYRLYKVLKDPLVFLFPFFSFFVNMIFIYLLYTTKQPLYHILHDLVGTLLGFGIVGYLLWINPTRRMKKELRST